jgi:predicted small lipoprotein YifL
MRGVILLLCVVAFMVAGLAGCGVVAPVVPPLAAVYTSVSAPLDTDLQETKLGPKKGEASCMSILGLVAVGDASIREAAKNGGITTIQAADYKFVNVLGVYQEFTTIVYGE